MGTLLSMVGAGAATLLLSACGHTQRFEPLTKYTAAQTCDVVQAVSTGGGVVRRADGTYAAVGGSPGQGEAFHLQPTGLGTYLLFGQNNEFLTAGAGGQVRAARSPNPGAVWQLSQPVTGRFVFTATTPARPRLTVGGTGDMLRATAAPPSDAHTQFRLASAGGCAEFPEAEVDATGTTFSGSAPTATVQGTVDAHAHITAFEMFGGRFHCGRPWASYGVEYALGNCASVQPGWYGNLAVVQNFLDWSDPFKAHHTAGWPNFVDWPGPHRLAEEGDYYTGLERAWEAGLRLVVTQYVDNEGLCFVMTLHACDDMASIRRQNADLHALQDYIDAQAGGPGKGFFRIVTDPFQARAVIDSGRLAVVEGAETSDVLGCGERGKPPCTTARIDARLAELWQLGIRSFFPIHKFDNAVGGTKMDAADLGVPIDLANDYYSGHVWKVTTCPGGSSTTEYDSQQLYDTQLSPVLRELVNGPFRVFGGTPLITHALPPHCNEQGLTALGRHVIEQMIHRHFLIELDHMDVKTADAALAVIENARYSGVVSAHSWDTAGENRRIYATGGFVAPSQQGTPAGFIGQWQIDRADSHLPYLFGFGYGSDMNGLAEQDQATDGRAGGKSITYPFTAHAGGVTFTRETWGNRVFDLNTDGVANYGLYADWLEALRVNADAEKKGDGAQILDDMFLGAEAYLETWERADGVPLTRCFGGTLLFTASGLPQVAILGDTAQSLLMRSGQPSARPGRAYRYCGGTSSPSPAGSAPTPSAEPLAAVFEADGGPVELVASVAPRASIGGIAVGAPDTQVSAHATQVADNVWLGPATAAGRSVWVTENGRVALAGVATAAAAGSTSRLSADLAASGLGVS